MAQVRKCFELKKKSKMKNIYIFQKCFYIFQWFISIYQRWTLIRGIEPDFQCKAIIWQRYLKNMIYLGFEGFELAHRNEALEPKKHFWKKLIFFRFQNNSLFDMKQFSIFCYFLDLEIQLIFSETLIKCIYHPQNSPKIEKELVE